ncbi:MAG: hypothetical protein ACXAB7_11725 [Candidatus Kariarchaeaceae archaeon]|jgi:hypothetical protein
MSEDEEWVRSLDIPGLALPGLRDLRIQFIALLEFDLLLGAVVHINELSRGSSYIKKLQNWHTLSEVYAGVARSPQHTIQTLEEDIAVFRTPQDGETDTVNVLLISCLPDTNLEPVRELGQKALFRAKGKPESIGKELSTCLREQLTYEKKLKTGDKKEDILIWDENRSQYPFDFEYIKGLAIYDLESKIADIRNLSPLIDGKEIKPKPFFEFVDNQLQSIVFGASTSMLFQDIPFLVTKTERGRTYIIVQINIADIFTMQKVSLWLNPFSEVLSKEWKLASHEEILAGLSLFNESVKRNTPDVYQERYARMLFRINRIKPTKGMGKQVEVDPPQYINNEQWEMLTKLDGSLSIGEIARQWQLAPIDAVTLFEWARVRNLIDFLQE